MLLRCTREAYYIYKVTRGRKWTRCSGPTAFSRNEKKNGFISTGMIPNQQPVKERNWMKEKCHRNNSGARLTTCTSTSCVILCLSAAKVWVLLSCALSDDFMMTKCLMMARCWYPFLYDPCPLSTLFQHVCIVVFETTSR